MCVKIVVLLLFISLSLLADLKQASVFQDSMILQREMEVPVWGTAKAGSEVSVSIDGKSATAKTDSTGKWMAKLPKLTAGGPFELVIMSGSKKIVLKDVLVGEVWICSGQSNMDMGHRSIPDYKDLLAESAKLPIRSLMVEKFVAFEKQQTFNGTWEKKICSSAVGASFSYHLQKALGVPVGIIQTSWGSSSLEGWLPYELTEKLPHFKAIMENFEKKDKAKVEGLLKNCRNKSGRITWERKDNIYMRTRPNILYNAMMHPLIPFACRGIAWYQGEANTRNIESMLQYSETLQTWLKYLRSSWGKEDLQLMPVMLPRFGRVQKGGQSLELDHPDARSWAWFRQSQLNLLQMPGTAVANTIDLGDKKDIHPKDKKPIGHRLTQLALKNIHKKEVVPQGPTFKEINIKNSSVTVHFDYADSINTTDGAAPKGFWIAGADKKWFKADAKIVKDTVVLNSNEVKNPVAVRYAFAAFPEVNLINGAKLPALPFRTDKWKP